QSDAEVTQLLAVRIGYFGGILRHLAPGASLDRNDVRMVLFRTRSRALYLGYILRGLLGTQWKIPRIELLHSIGGSCRALSQNGASRIFVEADGELLGTLPVEIGMAPDALSILAPGK